jgi:hypothetical protein
MPSKLLGPPRFENARISRLDFMLANDLAYQYSKIEAGWMDPEKR